MVSVVYNILPIVYYMRYEENTENKFLWRELLVSERTTTLDGKKLRDKVRTTLELNPYFHISDQIEMIVPNLECGKKNKQWHYHIVIKWRSLASIRKDTTFRSQIQKAFGVSNSKYDWKYRRVRTSIGQFWSYTTKDGNQEHSKNICMKWYDHWAGKYKPKVKSISAKSRCAEIVELMTRCEQCVNWNNKFCKDDVVRAVIDWYETNDKVYDTYQMKKYAETIYYRGENKDELVNLLIQKMSN